MNGTTRKLGNYTIAVTISPPRRDQSIRYSLKNDTYIIRRWMNRFSKHYMVYPELSPDMRLHYHGIAILTDPVKLYKTKHIINRQLGFSMIKRINTFDNKLIWLIYCRKQWGEMKGFQPIQYKRYRRRRKPPKSSKLLLTDYMELYNTTLGLSDQD